MSPRCPLCGQRRARRACPALGRQICAVCCGTKRLVEISCPSDCSYLLTSKSHPPAAVQRQKERDLAFLLPMLHGLTDRQHLLLLLAQGYLRSDRPDAASVVDDDVMHAAKALAETFETASRGIIYEHPAGLVSAERLSTDLKTLIDTRRSKGFQIPDTDAAIVMRRIEHAARDARTSLPGDKTAYLGMLKRVLRDPGTETSEELSSDQTDTGASGLIIPGH